MWSREELSSLPSFSEFVSWLIQDRESWAEVMGWSPYYSVCPPCQLNFTTLKLDGER